jgi:hypothetical protein
MNPSGRYAHMFEANKSSVTKKTKDEIPKNPVRKFLKQNYLIFFIQTRIQFYKHLKIETMFIKAIGESSIFNVIRSSV